MFLYQLGDLGARSRASSVAQCAHPCVRIEAADCDRQRPVSRIGPPEGSEGCYYDTGRALDAQGEGSVYASGIRRYLCGARGRARGKLKSALGIGPEGRTGRTKGDGNSSETTGALMEGSPSKPCQCRLNTEGQGGSKSRGCAPRVPRTAHILTVCRQPLHP